MARTIEEKKAYQKKWREKNKEKLKKYNQKYGKIWFQENKERLRDIRKEWRKNNIEKARKYGRESYYRHAEAYNKRAKEYRDSHVEERKSWRKKYRETERENEIRYFMSNPEKFQARWIINRQIRAKKIIRPKECSNCGNEGKIHAHHPDYSKPLEVIWLCSKCHHKIHNENIINKTQRKSCSNL
jgi:ribosomal protein S27AE